ncbi:MAG: DUF3825 domain-containing protein [Nitrososphaerota archaeon]|nr:DUF3825 domain-containing protein [Nitrososphaerota archaeon]
MDIISFTTSGTERGQVGSSNVPLWNFAYHPHPSWLESVAAVAKPEPWGTGYKVLELYLRANFEIAKRTGKIYENKENGMAFWRAGSLLNTTADPLWIVYRRNRRDFPSWAFREVMTGDTPNGEDAKKYEIKHEFPEFHRDWLIHFEQTGLQHILRDSRNVERLRKVFTDALGGTFNEHLIFRAIYGEIQLKRKEEAVLPQWYHGDYKFVMPLFLTQSQKVDLTAALEPDEALRRYVVKTLLMPNYAYAYTRAVVKSRDMFAAWMLLDERELEVAPIEDELE